MGRWVGEGQAKGEVYKYKGSLIQAVTARPTLVLTALLQPGRP